VIQLQFTYKLFLLFFAQRQTSIIRSSVGPFHCSLPRHSLFCNWGILSFLFVVLKVVGKWDLLLNCICAYSITSCFVSLPQNLYYYFLFRCDCNETSVQLMYNSNMQFPYKFNAVCCIQFLPSWYQISTWTTFHVEPTPWKTDGVMQSLHHVYHLYDALVTLYETIQLWVRNTWSIMPWLTLSCLN